MKTSSARTLLEPASIEPEVVPNSLVARRCVLAAEDPVWAAPARSGGRPTTDEVLNARAPVDMISRELVERIVAIVMRPRIDGESHDDAAGHRERDLLVVVAELTPIQAFEIGRRIAVDRADDPLVAVLKRLVPARRSRLVHALSRRR